MTTSRSRLSESGSDDVQPGGVAQRVLESYVEGFRAYAGSRPLYVPIGEVESLLKKVESEAAVVPDDESSEARLARIVSEIELGMNCEVRIGQDVENTPGRLFFQIQCWRQDTITKEMGWGYGGKAYLSPHATDSELIQTIFGLYKGYWEHEARETFIWRGRRPFGPHIATEALWEVARRVDVRSAKHVEDSERPHQ